MCTYSVLLYSRKTHIEPKKSKETPLLCSVKCDTSAKNSYSDGDKADSQDDTPPKPLFKFPPKSQLIIKNITDEEEIKFFCTKECRSVPSRTKGN